MILASDTVSRCLTIITYLIASFSSVESPASQHSQIEFPTQSSPSSLSTEASAQSCSLSVNAPELQLIIQEFDTTSSILKAFSQVPIDPTLQSYMQDIDLILSSQDKINHLQIANHFREARNKLINNIESFQIWRDIISIIDPGQSHAIPYRFAQTYPASTVDVDVEALLVSVEVADLWKDFDPFSHNDA